MSNFRILIALIFSASLSSTGYAATVESTEEIPDIGTVVVLSDGSVVCRIIDGYRSGGIDCKYERKGYRPDNQEVRLTIPVGTIVRKHIGGRLCYSYDTYHAGGISSP